MNPVNEAVLGNTVSALIGMVTYGGKRIDTHGEKYIATTLMGITNDTVMRASDELTALGRKMISFHSTGIGGRVMESMIREGVISAVMDLSLHEMTAEYLGAMNGLGIWLQAAFNSFRTPLIFSATIMVVALTALLLTIISLAERLLLGPDDTIAFNDDGE